MIFMYFFKVHVKHSHGKVHVKLSHSKGC